MATRKQPIPPVVPPVYDDIKPSPAPPVPQGVTGVGERGTERDVPFVIDSAGRKFVGEGHPDCGKPF